MPVSVLRKMALHPCSRCRMLPLGSKMCSRITIATPDRERFSIFPIIVSNRAKIIHCNSFETSIQPAPTVMSLSVMFIVVQCLSCVYTDGVSCSSMYCDVKWISPLRPDTSFVINVEIMSRGLSDVFESTQLVMFYFFAISNHQYRECVLLCP